MQEKPKTTPLLWSTKEVAEALCVSTATVRNWVRSGVLPPPDLRRSTLHRWERLRIERWVEKEAKKTERKYKAEKEKDA